ncbi:MAG: hypothetical protein CL607_02585 [Anaerolineaceae bacterium]|nr:hypothetical protein [Anaerolineaceae bacterium]
MTESATSDQQDMSHIPIAGREAIYMQIQQHLMDTSARHALAYIGYAGIGKTALLRQLPMYVDLAIISVFLPLSDLVLDDEEALLTRFVIRTTQVLAQYDYSLSRIPALSDDEDDDAPSMREWLRDEYLPQVMGVIRGARRLLWLLDDFDLLMDAIKKGDMPEDFIDYLHSLMLAQPQLGIVLTAHTDDETRLLTLEPFIKMNAIHRLHALPLDAGIAMLKEAAPYFSQNDLTKLHQATGGHPLWLAHGATLLDATASMSEIIDRVYPLAAADIAHIWGDLQPNEQYILQALADLYYQNPLANVTLQDVTQWIINSGVNMDSTDIHSALRSLEFRELINNTDGKISIRADLVRRWLLQNQNSHPQRQRASSDTDSSRSVDLRLIAILVGIAIVAVIVLWLLSQVPGLAGGDVVPTVTFSS